MRSDDEVWLVAGGEPGAQRFGQLVQHLRKELCLSVETLAERASLSIGTIRAIEQGRRAPSEESGVRLLSVLMPDDSVNKEDGAEDQAGSVYFFTDPQSGSGVRLIFQAKKAGDNRRWSSDGPRAVESKAEALIREMMDDPVRRAEWTSKVVPALEAFALRADEIVERSVRPASDAEFGGIVRRLASIRALRIWHLETLVELWERVDGGTASERERSLAAQLDQVLAGYTPITDDMVFYEAE